ncbi:MAG: type IVB secretion system apparatus protein IcmL/DotI [Coxiellaceae bacterium]|nr:type IVB secretion system apparatus protein IcmL/DotI [Coxiellaceae bacterium]
MTDEAENANKLSQEGVTLVLMRNAFYRDNYRRAVFALIIVFFINVALASAIVYRYLNPPSPQYFAANSQYQLIKWHPLSDPIVSNNWMLQWVTTAVLAAFSLDYIHWRQQLQHASTYFTPSGWYWFLSAFKQSGNLQTLVSLKMVSNAVVTAAPVVQYQNVLNGRYVWKVQLPLMVTYTSPAKTINQPLKVTLIVERVPVQDSPDRIAINQFLPEVQTQ